MTEKNGILQSSVEGEACFSTNYGGLDVVLPEHPKSQQKVNLILVPLRGSIS